VLALALVGGVLANHVPLRGWTSAQALQVAGDGLGFVLAGAALGMVARLLDRSAAALRAAAEGEVRAVRRATRLAERESLARQLHDSVLQALALVAKRGRELAGQERVPGAAVGELAELAAAQERTVRGLLLRPLEDEDGEGSLREALDAAAATVAGTLEVSVGAVGVPPLPAGHVRELGAAVQQALANVERHAQARHVWIYAEEVEGTVVVSVRDDGVGFAYDEAALRAAGKIGLLRSMRGRVEGLGGVMLLDSAQGRGTEVEFRVPVGEGGA
jgi:signal transduction histidine kinase